jgi:hypothetical protein
MTLTIETDTYTLFQHLFHALRAGERGNKKAMRVTKLLMKQMGFYDAFNAGRRAVRKEVRRRWKAGEDWATIRAALEAQLAQVQVRS